VSAHGGLNGLALINIHSETEVNAKEIVEEYWLLVSGFCTVCELNFPTAFREPLWVLSSLVSLMTSEDGTYSGSRNVVGKFASHTVQNPQTKNQYSFHGKSLKSKWQRNFKRKPENHTL
jgi:hypothetical protein